jgi:hypothetical protein
MTDPLSFRPFTEVANALPNSGYNSRTRRLDKKGSGSLPALPCVLASHSGLGRTTALLNVLRDCCAHCSTPSLLAEVVNWSNERGIFRKLSRAKIMDHFESLICTLLEAEGYWTRRSFKVNVTKEEKRQIGKHSIPRPEIDILAFRFSENSVLAVEVKSFLDSPGLKLEKLQAQHEVPEGRYKLFTSDRYRSIVLPRLRQDLIHCGMANNAFPTLCCLV